MTSISSNVSLVAFVRASLKFDPRESIALVLCNESAVLATMRVNLDDMEATAWANLVGNLLRKVTENHPVDATLLVAYDELGNFDSAKHDAVANVLEDMGAPIRRSILVADNKISNFDGTDAEPYSAITSEPITLQGMVTGRNPLRAKDIEHCEESSEEVQTIAVARKAEIFEMNPNIASIAQQIGHEMITQIAIYREAGEVTEEIAGWLAGTFSVKVGRDMAVLALAGTATDTQGIAEYLLGDRIVEDYQILEDGHEMLFESLAHIAGTPRANILCAVAWAHWTRGNTTQAMATLTEVMELEPDHELGDLFIKLIARGKVTKTALRKPEK